MIVCVWFFGSMSAVEGSYDEGKGASSIISRGIPVGLTEGFDSGCKDCVLREVGQHKLTIGDQDIVYYDAKKQKACVKGPARRRLQRVQLRDWLQSSRYR